MATVQTELDAKQLMRQDCLHQAVRVLTNHGDYVAPAEAIVAMAEALATWVIDGNPPFSLGTTTTTTTATVGTTHTDEETMS